MKRRECYVLLGLDENASQEDIKKAYRKLAKQYHPDRTQNDEFLANMFRKLKQAYDILSQPPAPESDNDQDDRNTGLQACSNKQLEVLIKRYWEERKAYGPLQDDLYRLSHYPMRNYLNFANLMAIAGIFVVAGVFFYPDRLRGTAHPGPQQHLANWSVGGPVDLYVKPDRKSKVIGKLDAGTPLDSLGATKYFFKVRTVVGTDSVTGYVLKENINTR